MYQLCVSVLPSNSNMKISISLLTVGIHIHSKTGHSRFWPWMAQYLKHWSYDHQFLVHYLRKKQEIFFRYTNKHCLANEKQIILQIDDYMFKNLLNESIWICLYLILSINDFIRDSICEYQCFCLFHFSLSPTLVAFSNVVLIFAMGMISQFEQLMSYSLEGI